MGGFGLRSGRSGCWLIRFKAIENSRLCRTRQQSMYDPLFFWRNKTICGYVGIRPLVGQFWILEKNDSTLLKIYHAVPMASHLYELRPKVGSRAGQPGVPAERPLAQSWRARGGNSFWFWHTFGPEAIFGKIDLSKRFDAKGLRLQLSRKRRGGDSVQNTSNVSDKPLVFRCKCLFMNGL